MISAHIGAVKSIVFSTSRDSNVPKLVTGGEDHSVRMWDFEAYVITHTHNDHKAAKIEI